MNATNRQVVTVKAASLALALLALGAVRAGAADSLRLVESEADRLVCARDPDTHLVSCDVSRSGMLRISAVVFAGQSLQASDYDSNTTVQVTIGSWTFSHTLGDAAGYRNGVSRALFLLKHQVIDAKGNPHDIVHGSVWFVITPSALYLSVNTQTDPTGTVGELPAVADAYSPDPAFGPEMSPAEIQFADFDTGNFNVAVSGTIRHRTVTSQGTPYDLMNVMVVGEGEAAASTP